MSDDSVQCERTTASGRRCTRPAVKFLPGAELHATVADCGRSHDAPDTSSKVDRNGPCPCGSGVKWKRCCSPAARDVRAREVAHGRALREGLEAVADSAGRVAESLIPTHAALVGLEVARRELVDDILDDATDVAPGQAWTHTELGCVPRPADPSAMVRDRSAGEAAP